MATPAHNVWDQSKVSGLALGFGLRLVVRTKIKTWTSPLGNLHFSSTYLKLFTQSLVNVKKATTISIHTCVSGKWPRESACPTGKSTSPRLSDMAFVKPRVRVSSKGGLGGCIPLSPGSIPISDPVDYLPKCKSSMRLVAALQATWSR